MTNEQMVLLTFSLLIGGLMLPLSSGKRATLWVALIIASVMTLAAGSMLYVRGLFD